MANRYSDPFDLDIRLMAADEGGGGIEADQGRVPVTNNIGDTCFIDCNKGGGAPAPDLIEPGSPTDVGCEGGANEMVADRAPMTNVTCGQMTCATCDVACNA